MDRRCDSDFMSIGIGFGFAYDFVKIGRPAGDGVAISHECKIVLCGHQLSFNFLFD